LARSPAAALPGAFPEALNRHLRGESPRLAALPGFEHEGDDLGHLPSHLAGPLYAFAADWKPKGYVNDAVLRILDLHLRAPLDVRGACERIRNTPLAPSYTSPLRTGLALNVLAEPCYALAEIGPWGIPIFLRVCLFLLGVEFINSVAEEPFGREREDLDRYCQTISDSMRKSLPAGSEAGRPSVDLA
jgi:putative membrane protein